jgi:hypothetical protein
MMLALILLGVMHIVLPSTGGSGADLPEPLLVWCVLLVAMVGCAWFCGIRGCAARSCAAWRWRRYC